jgi:2-polyprenyl-3-methyl-5-hydroxy-6-metoxy-1,4-benzoquinol methylase
MQENKTLEYYNENAESFIAGTIAVDFEQTQLKFTDKLKAGAYILDFGCGSGRDTKYFLSKGFKVDAVDGSEELCKRASKFTGICVRQMLFQELDKVAKYDGIWACSSILHLPKRELEVVLEKMLIALKDNGVIYTSFKHSDFEGIRGGRYFTDFTIESFHDFIKMIHGVTIEEYWITGDARPGRGDEKWLNLLLRKTGF